MNVRWLSLTLCIGLLLILLSFAQPAAAAPLPQNGTTQPLQANSATPYAIGWGTLTLINAGIAQGKNRSGLIWFLLTIVLGPIATFLLVVFFPKKPASATP